MFDPEEEDNYRDVDYDSHVGKPFYTEAKPCESCGKPCDSRRQASWDPDLMVGPCCEIYLGDLAEDQPLCETLHELVCRAQTVQAVCDAFDQHAKSGCLICNPVKKEVGTETAGEKQERRAA